ncbi:M48 family metallopeptidase [Neptunomonas sp.]|uniref:M48 family metallopeptidase n=1 Tax=Neptunomonas sp. TaxID=1971898 RepID=UPI0025EC5989|nr:M48 family metallopeptidase [Neptunomonas sp.]
MLITGHWYKKGSAAQSSATLRFSNELCVIETNELIVFSGHLEEINVSDRLGNVERKLTLRDGSLFATQDNNAIDKLFKSKKANQYIHTIESHMGWVAVALVVTLLTSFAFFKWGVPWASTKIAHALPHKTNELIATHTFDFLDGYIFDESQITPQRKEEIRNHFNENVAPLDDSGLAINYRIHFRQWSSGDTEIPNALALPSGDIILTDSFVKLSENQHEIDSVLLHEMGHIVHRHTLQRVVESTFITTVIMLVTGDGNSITDMGTGLGSILVSSNYSRGHESEADAYAFKHMLSANIDPQHFSNIISRITAPLGKTELHANEDTDSGLTSYFSSHPVTKERVLQANKYHECFKKGLTSCQTDTDEHPEEE